MFIGSWPHEPLRSKRPRIRAEAIEAKQRYPGFHEPTKALRPQLRSREQEAKLRSGQESYLAH